MKDYQKLTFEVYAPGTTYIRLPEVRVPGLMYVDHPKYFETLAIIARCDKIFKQLAQMAESVDAKVSKTFVARCEGSSPSLGTNE
jgi:hypothetical protein